MTTIMLHFLEKTTIHVYANCSLSLLLAVKGTYEQQLPMLRIAKVQRCAL